MFSQTTEYALRAMVCLAAAGDELVPTADLARATKVPSNYLAKVLQQLSAEHLINGRRGVGGGYRLARPAASVRLLDIINAVCELRRIDDCPLGVPGHCGNLCSLHKTMDRAANALIEIFSGMTLADVVSEMDSDAHPLCDMGARISLTVSARNGKLD